MGLLQNGCGRLSDVGFVVRDTWWYSRFQPEASHSSVALKALLYCMVYHVIEMYICNTFQFCDLYGLNLLASS